MTDKNGFDQRDMTILIVDDEPRIRDFVPKDKPKDEDKGRLLVRCREGS